MAITSAFGSWHSAVALATGTALIAMATTAGVSVLASDEVAAAGDLYGTRTFLQRAGGKRAVRVSQVAVVPAPDAGMVTYVPTFTRLANDALGIVQPILSTMPVRPLHEAEEVPENFI